MNTLHLWNLEGSTPTEMIKSVPAAGGRKQSAIDTYYKLKTITKVLGPMGIGWGLVIKSVQAVPCKVWKAHELAAGTMLLIDSTFWFKCNEELLSQIFPEGDVNLRIVSQGNFDRYEFDMLNNITMDGDEDCGKKLLTDTITKAASYLGFFNDVFMGAFDGDRYVVEKMEKADDSMKEEFLRLCDEVKAMGYPEEKIATMMDYHERQGYITASVKPDVLSMSKWIIKHGGAERNPKP